MQFREMCIIRKSQHRIGTLVYVRVLKWSKYISKFIELQSPTQTSRIEMSNMGKFDNTNNSCLLISTVVTRVHDYWYTYTRTAPTCLSVTLLPSNSRFYTLCPTTIAIMTSISHVVFCRIHIARKWRERWKYIRRITKIYKRVLQFHKWRCFVSFHFVLFLNRCLIIQVIPRIRRPRNYWV